MGLCEYCSKDLGSGWAEYCTDCYEKYVKNGKMACWRCHEIVDHRIWSGGMCEECEQGAVRNVKSFVYGDPDYNPFMR